jgi:hypothetical protein
MLEQLAPQTGLPTQIPTKTFFKRLPKFAFIGEKSTKLTTLSAKNRVFPTLSAVMRLLTGKSCSWRNPGLKRTQLSNIFKKFSVKTFKLKINLTRNNLNFSSFQPNHQSCETIPLRLAN